MMISSVCLDPGTYNMLQVNSNESEAMDGVLYCITNAKEMKDVALIF